MYSDRFLKTMIEVVKYDEFDNKHELLSVIRNSTITFSPTKTFATRRYQLYLIN
jgi:hypothetical protein